MRKAIRGVSSVIGTFLVLVITVALFSTIFAWVQTFPPPPGRVNTDFSAEAWYEATGSGYYAHVNITQIAGEPIPTSQIRIVIITENNTRYSLTPADGGLTARLWETGMVWKWKSSNLFTAPQNLTVEMINTVKNILFWQKLIIVNNIWYPPLIQSSGSTPSPVVSGNPFKIWAEVYDYDLNNQSVYADLSQVGLGRVKLSNISGSATRFESPELVTYASPGTYSYTLNASDFAGHTTIRKFSLTLVSALAEVPLPKLVVNQITLNPPSPTRGETVLITAIIKNLQSTPASSAIVTTTDTIIETNSTTILNSQSISVPGYGETQVFITWVAQPGGAHIIDISISDVQPGGVSGQGKNVSVVVMPRILFVDDDGAGIGNPNDMGANFIAALDAINVNYTSVSVALNSSGPGYDTGPVQYQLRNFDVVIWEGGLTNNSLTAADVLNLQRFLDNGGRLWLSGANILENVSGSFLNTYLGISSLLPASNLPGRIYGTNYGSGWINASSLKPVINTTAFIATRPLSLLSSNPLFVNESGALKFGNQFKRTVGIYESRVVVLSFEIGAFRYTADHAILAYLIINWLAGINARTGDDLAIASQELSTLTPRYREPINISAVVRNNGDTGHSDVEVQLIVYANGVEIDREWPITGPTVALEAFGDSKTVNFTWTPEYVGIFLLQVMVDPYNKIAEVNERNNVYNNTLLLSQVNVIYTTLIVDDDGSANNGGSLPDSASEVIRAMQSLGYTSTDMDIQVVPKGADRNNSEYNISRYNCVIWITGQSYNGSGYNTLTSKDISLLQNYYLTDDPRQHALIIIGVNILNDSAIANTPFMRNILGANNTGTPASYPYAKVLFGVRESPITNGLEFGFTNTSFTTYSARAYNKTERALGLFWADGITHWDRVSDNVLGSAVFDSAGWHAAYLGIDLAYTSNRTMIAEIMLSLVHWCGRIDARPEIKITAPDIYAATHSRPYIYLRDLHPQLGSSYLLKINITNLGGLNASINVRFLDGDTVIGARNVNVPPSFSNETGYVFNGKAISEVIWVPLFAGYETIRVTADQEGVYANDEFIRANNNASQQIQVFFFYDDMEDTERTEENWNHDATLLNINGETPLDFLARKDVSTRVIGDWDWNLSGNTDLGGRPTYNGNGTYLTNSSAVVNYTKGAAHTMPSAYWLPEVSAAGGQRIPLDVFLVLDNSGSMAEDPDGDGRTKWQDAVSAIQNDILPYLTSVDYLTLIAFSDPANANYADLNSKAGYVLGPTNLFSQGTDSGAGTGEAVNIWYSRSQMTDANKQQVINTLTSSAIVPISGVRYNTPIWDAIGVGIMYAKYYNDTEDFVGGNVVRYPAVIVLSDGMDWGKYRGSGYKVGEGTYPGNDGPHGGSEVFGPWWTWGEDHSTQQTQLPGDILSDDDGFLTNLLRGAYGWNWYPLVLSNQDSRRNSGLLNLANEPEKGTAGYVKPHIGGKIPVFTVGLGLMHFDPPSYGYIGNHYGHDAGTQEYWLWKISSTSPARNFGVGYDGYFYAAQSSALGEIFKKIVEAISGPGGVTKISPTPAFINPRISSATVFTDSFETGLSAWSITSGSWSAVTAASAPNWPAYAGSYYLLYQDDAGTGGADIISTASRITIPSNAVWVIFSFAARWYAPNDDLYVAVNDGSGWRLLGQKIGYVVRTPLNETSTLDDKWVLFSADLTRFKGTSIYVGFYVEDRATSGNYIGIDDVKLIYLVSSSSGGTEAYNIPPAKYRFLTTPAVRVGTPYLSFWNYASGSYETGNLPDHVVVIDYENHYYWLYDASGAVAYQGNFVVLQNNSWTGNASGTGALQVAPVTYIVNPTPDRNVWFRINDNYGWKYWYLPAVPHAVLDMLIAWEDLWGTVPLSNIDGNGDQWVRVTLLDDGTFRVVPYRASGGYEHDFFVGSDWVYIKHHGEAWSNGSGASETDPYKEVYVVPSGQRFPLFMRKSEGGTLSFYTKYSMTQGTNGGFLYLWGSTDGRTWVWDRQHRVYLEPKQPYNGNVKLEALQNESTTGGLTGNGWIDIDGKLPYWCFNGKSGGGTYGWEKIEVDLARYVRTFAAIRIVFVFAQFGGVLPPEWSPDMGWYIDDVQIRVKGGVPDYWKVVEDATKAHSGSRYWYYCAPSGYLPLGIDASLYTIPIDLTRAYRATLIAFFKFNINEGAGLPPDGIRVEVSKDNGETWYSITYGVRIGWGYTGRDTADVESRGYYGVNGDLAGGELSQRYTGVRGTLYKTNWTFVRASNANTASAYDWIPSFTLVRLNCDLSGFAGNTIILRIRVFTNATGSETDAIHYASPSYDKGVFVDDVFVIGTTITHGLSKP